MAKVVISYSHKDQRWLDRLLVHLRPIEQAGTIEVWSDRQIKAGTNWTNAIESALAGGGCHSIRADLLVFPPMIIRSTIAPPCLCPACLR
jgi:hypothetical protein